MTMTTDAHGHGGRETPMGAHPPEAPHIDEIIAQAFREVEPADFRDHPDSAVEAADMDVDDTIGAE